MSDNSGIEWTDATWNPVTGCTKVSPGCDHCYAETFAERFRGVPGHHFESGFDITLRPERLDRPIRWKRPRRIFVNSMSDLFHDDVPDEYIAKVFAAMALAPQHTFQLLTKRHGRMRSVLNSHDFWTHVGVAAMDLRDVWLPSAGVSLDAHALPNVHLGVSVEDQKWADIRIPALRATPAAVRFISAEPLLGAFSAYLDGIGWVICGGESGPGARPMHPLWARSLRDQCIAAGVPFLFKQWGEWGPTDEVIKAADARTMAMHPAGMVAMIADNPFDPFAAGHPHWESLRRWGKKSAGRTLDGRTWDEYPAEHTPAVTS